MFIVMNDVGVFSTSHTHGLHREAGEVLGETEDKHRQLKVQV